MKSHLGDEILARPGIDNLVTLEIAKDEDLPRFKKDLQEAFAVALIEEFGSVSEPIPSDADMERSFKASGSVVYRILADGRWVGGAVLTIDGATHHNALALFYISVKEHSRGIGQKAWKAIEERYPETKCGRHTPRISKGAISISTSTNAASRSSPITTRTTPIRTIPTRNLGSEMAVCSNLKRSCDRGARIDRSAFVGRSCQPQGLPPIRRHTCRRTVCFQGAAAS